MTTAFLDRQSVDATMELWVVEHQGRIVSSGRLEPVAGTEFAGVWGGSAVEGWRGRGIYRARRESVAPENPEDRPGR